MAEQPQTLTIPQALDLAAQHHQAGRLAEAEALYQQVLQKEPDHPSATHMLGGLAYQDGKNELAVKLISRALKLQPDLAEACNNLGATQEALGNLGEAEASYRKSISIRPTYTDAHYNLARIYEIRGDRLSSLRHLRQYRRLMDLD